MKKLSLAFLGILSLLVLMTFQNCGEDDEPTPAENTKNILMSKTWVYGSVNTPANTATIGDDWINFSVQFSESTMTTSGHPTGASAVWPSGGYTISEDGNTITRTSDNVTIVLNPLSESNLTATFTVPAGTELSRVAALGGEYVFNLK